MRQHIVDVCAAHNIWARYDDNVREPYAIRETYGAADEIMVRPIKSPITYAVALHEIGHILGRNQNSWLPMVRERWAWQWARVNALNWTDAMERYAARCLRDAARCLRTMTATPARADRLVGLGLLGSRKKKRATAA